MREQMKTKNFYVLLLLLFVSLCAVWLCFSPSPDLHTIVTETHKQISNLKNLQPRLKKPREVEVDVEYLKILGFTKHPSLFSSKLAHSVDVQLPVVGSSVTSGELQHALRLLRTTQKYLPTRLVVFFDLGLDTDDRSILKEKCNFTTSCVVKKFEFDDFPSHVSYQYMKAYRPLCIQTALKEFGAVIWVDPRVYFVSDQINQSLSQAQDVGLAGWTIVNPTSALTHPKMFEYFKTLPESYYFHRAVQTNHLIMYNTARVHKDLMLPWVKCALTEDCINPTGAQNTGCNYRRRPFFRYSGCHHYDMSALNIILGQVFNFDFQQYAVNDKVFNSLDTGLDNSARNFSFIGGERYIAA